MAGPLSPVEPDVPVPASRVTLPEVTRRTQRRPLSATRTRPAESTSTPVGPLSDTAVAAPANEHAVLAPPPASWLTTPAATLRMQLLPASAM
jgi:hypothetical protein